MFRSPRQNAENTNAFKILNTTPNRALKPKILNNINKELNNGSPKATGENKVFNSPNEGRRGRPRADCLNALILEGSTSPSSIKCTYCGRVFPREKSLQAHLRTHTGEKPYFCDYPRCTRRFAQSGQLKTHQRLHTGEKPFICSEINCDQRFTHANRRCQFHPDATLKRFTTPVKVENEKIVDEDHYAEVRAWLNNEKRIRRSPSRELQTTPKRQRTKLEFNNENTYSLSNWFRNSSEDSNSNETENTPPSPDMLSTASGEYLNKLENDKDSATSGSCSTERVFELPKKRWLREATKVLNESDSEDQGGQEKLALPINWDDQAENIQLGPDMENNSQSSCSSDNLVMLKNQNRPSVLVCMHDGQKKTITNDEIQSAIALVELKNSGDSYSKCNYRI